VENNTNFKIVNCNPEELNLNLKLKNNDFNVNIATIYGNEVPQVLLGKKLPLTDLLFSKFDDIWLSQLLAIEERTNLLKFNSNVLLRIKEKIDKDVSLRKIFDGFIMSEGQEKNLNELLEMIKDKIDNKFIPERRNKENYISDMLYFYGSKES